MNSISLFTPLPHDYCLWFYLLCVAGFILFVFTLISGIFIGITKRKDFSFYLVLLYFSVLYLIMYFQNRILYSMCIKSI